MGNTIMRNWNFGQFHVRVNETIPHTAGTIPDPAGNHTHTRSSQPNQAIRTPDFSYPLVSSTLFSSSSLICLFPIHNSSIIPEHKVELFLSISPWHDHELTLSTAYTEYSIHRVQHTPRRSIHRVQHTPKIVSHPFILMIKT